jgi:hypothetical protein
MTSITTNHRYSNDRRKDNDIKVIRQLLERKTLTMKQITFETGILREHVCRRIADLRNLNQVVEVRKGICPITKYPNVIFWSCKPENLNRNE